MYCGQCGKRVLDDMLFCPFCGSPIVIPDQDEPKPEGVGGAKLEREIVTPAEPAEANEAPVVEEELAAEAAGEVAGEDSGEAAEDAAAEVSAEVAEEAEAEISDEVPGEIPAEAAEPKPARWEDTAFPIDEAEQAALAAKANSRDADEAEEGESSRHADDAEEEKSPWPSDEPEPEDEPFAPLEIGRAELSFEDAEVEPPEPRRDEPQRRSSPKRRAPVGGGRSVTQTFIPVRDVNPNDMFMDSSHPAARDDYDPYDDGGPEDDFDDGFAFEEPEPEGFAQRHIRGLVGVALMLALLAVFLVWAMLPAGQRVLASANLAWSADVYNNLGYEAYEAGEFHQAASCFERALARDGDNYEYAHSAMVAYFEGGETGSALAMLKRCIDMEPDNPEPYAELLILYPDAASRPWDVQQLLHQGYERTGEEALNVAGE